MFSLKRTITKIVQTELLKELRSITDSCRREEAYLSRDHIMRLVDRAMEEKLQRRIDNVINKETFIDGIIERIKRKQL